MAYMIYQQYKTAVHDGYRDRSDAEISREAGHAARTRLWLESLSISDDIRAGLIEQIRAIEEAFEEILRDPHRSPPRRSPA